MKIIPVKMRGKKASLKCLVDDEDYEELMGYKWSSLVSSSGGIYAKRGFTDRVRFPKKRQVYAMMHQMILQCPDGYVIDHINRDGLDNQKINLRICSQAENIQNSRAPISNRSGYKGVSWNSHKQKWVAQITSNKKKYYLGSSRSLINCLLAYRLAAKKLHGEYARIK